MQCPNPACGKQIADNAAFCPYCGSKITKTVKSSKRTRVELTKPLKIALVAVGALAIIFLAGALLRSPSASSSSALGTGSAASYDAERKSNAPEEPVEPPADQSEATPSETEAFTVDDLEDSYSSIFIKRGDLFYRAETATWRYYRTVSFWDESEGFYLYRDPERVAEGNGEDDNPYSVSEIDRAAGDELVIRANVDEYTFYSVLDSAYAGEYRLEDMWIEELNGQPISTDRSVYGDSIREVLAQDGIQVIETIEGDYMISDVPTSCTYGMYSNEAQWGEYTREIDVPVRLINEAEGTCYTVPVIEGREGYFTIDISSLPAGEYFFMASYRRYGQAFYALANII